MCMYVCVCCMLPCCSASSFPFYCTYLIYSPAAFPLASPVLTLVGKLFNISRLLPPPHSPNQIDKFFLSYNPFGLDSFAFFWMMGFFSLQLFALRHTYIKCTWLKFSRQNILQTRFFFWGGMSDSEGGRTPTFFFGPNQFMFSFLPFPVGSFIFIRELLHYEPKSLVTALAESCKTHLFLFPPSSPPWIVFGASQVHDPHLWFVINKAG